MNMVGFMRPVLVFFIAILIALPMFSCGEDSSTGPGDGGTTGTTYLVNPDGTGDLPTIQAAIDSASNGDIILLADGVYTGTGNRDVDFHGKGVTVKSISGDPELCIIDCEGNWIKMHRGFVFQSDEGPSSKLQGITIKNGWANDDGAIMIDGDSSPVIDNCILRNNAADTTGNGYGGGIYCYGSPTITNCQIIANAAGNRGGGIYSGENASISHCSILGNAASDGGGIHCRQGTNVSFCLVAYNTAITGYQYGGGISCRYSQGTISNCTVVGNKAPQSAGIAFYGDGPLVRSCIVANNIDGGGLGWGYGGANSNPTIECCDIWGNIGDYGDEIPDAMTDGGGNFSLDPLFCDPASDDYTLRQGSPCLSGNHPDGASCGLIGCMEQGCL